MVALTQIVVVVALTFSLSLSLDCLINGGGGFDCLNSGGGGFDCLISGGGSWVFLSLRFFVLVVFVAFLD